MSLIGIVKSGWKSLVELSFDELNDNHEVLIRRPSGDPCRVKIKDLKSLSSTSGSGWMFYDDSEYTSGSPLSVNNSRVQYTNDGDGANTNKDSAPVGISDFWDTANNKITPENKGDAFELRIDFTASMAQTNAYALLQLDIGDGSAINIVERTITFPRGSGIAHKFSLGFPIFVGSTFLTNGGKLYFDTTAGSDNMTVYDKALFLNRIHKGDSNA